MTIASYRYSLGNGLALTAYSIDPSISENDLRKMVSSKDGSSGFDLKKLRGNMTFIERMDSLGKWEINAIDEPYHVPEQLRPYREALQAKLDSEGKFNGPVPIVRGL